MSHRFKTHVKPAKFERRYAPAVVDDLTLLGEFDPSLVDVALAAFDDLAFGRQRGKLLGERKVTGDLTGLARLRFDLPDQRPLRFRIVYRLVAADIEHLPTIEVRAIGERADHVIYRETLARLDSVTDDSFGDSSDE